jgi:hypothetical protein
LTSCARSRAATMTTPSRTTTTRSDTPSSATVGAVAADEGAGRVQEHGPRRARRCRPHPCPPPPTKRRSRRCPTIPSRWAPPPRRRSAP